MTRQQDMSFDYDTVPTGYYDRIYHKRSGVQSKWHHAKFTRFARAMPASGSHLDIGCGPGTFIGTLPEGGYSSLGIDIASAQVAYAETHYGGDNRAFQAVQPGPLPFKDDAFDIVSLIELIEHLHHEDNVALLSDALRVTRPGGQVFVSTPNYGSCWPWVEKLVSRRGAVDYTDQHITHYNRQSLIDLLMEAGANDVTVEGYMFLAPFTAALSWRFADFVESLEPAILVDRFGLLLFASGRKTHGV
jgi:2-polyprenyl-3-methyl-5-hydroxy-6-metoxy-1,4-benzoquinol methylase